MRFFIGMVLGLALGIAGAWYLGGSTKQAFSEVDEATVAGGEDTDPIEVAASEAPAAMTTPAYMLVLGEVYDRPAFGAGYAAKLPPLYDEFGGEYIAIGGGVEVLEGDYAPKSFVIGRWPSMEAAQAFWNSEGYDALRRARIDNGWGDFDVLLVPGLPQPITRAPLVDESE